MHEPTSVTTSQTMSSREIAELTNKEHKHVKRDCEVMFAELELDASRFGHIYFDSMNRQQTEYALTYELVQTLITGYSIKIRYAVIQRLNYLEALQQPNPAPAQLTTLEILRIATEAEQGRLQAIAERDHAIATKAQIGSKREATAMATASAASRKVVELQAELGRCKSHATIIAVQNVTGKSYKWQPLKKWCKERGLKPIEVVDPRWGVVKSWPAQAWLDVHAVDINIF